MGEQGDRRAVPSYFVREMPRLARTVAESVPHHVAAKIPIAILVPTCYRNSSSVRASLPEGAHSASRCAMFASRYLLIVDRDSRFFQFVSLTTGEPQADLFAVPANYQEVPPSKLFGSAKESDAYYYAHRPR